MGLRFWRRDEPEPGATRSIFYPSALDLSAYAMQPFGLSFTQNPEREEEIIPSFVGFVQGVYATSGPIAACILARASLFSEVPFRWRQFSQGEPGNLFGNQDLAPLEKPWPNGTTRDLIVRLEQDYSLAGNFYGWRNGSGIARMRPDWVTIVLGSNMETDDPAAALDARVIGYIYHPGGRNSGKGDPVPLRVEEVCHFTGPTPDPTARFRGTSWLTSILADVQADRSATTNKQRYFEQGGPNVAISVDIPDVQEFQAWVEAFKQQAESPANAYKRLFFNTGTPSVETIGSTLEQAQFSEVQNAGVLRICSVAGVPPIIIGFEPATFANYQLAMRRFADLTARPMWGFMAECFESVLTVPPGARLAYDDRHIPALKDDIASIADRQAKQATAANQAFQAGFLPDSIVSWLASDDITQLNHSGVQSVQTQGNGAAPALNPPPAQQQLPPAREEVMDELEQVLGRSEEHAVHN